MPASFESANREIRLTLSQANIELAQERLVECMSATRRVRSRVRTPEGGIAYEDIPDPHLRLAAAVKVLEFGIGKPKQSIALEQSGGRQQSRPVDLNDLILKHPEAVRAIMDAVKRVPALEPARTVGEGEKQDTSSSSDRGNT